MLKALIGKTQKIAPKLNPVESNFAGTINISPDEDDSISKRGYLYAVFELLDITKYETDLTSKLIKDILGRSYYHSENASPIQALEKAIADVRKDILHLQEGDEDSKVEFSIIASVLWAGVLYTVKHGKGKIFVVRGGEFKNIEMLKEGNFSVATGMIKKEDVVVLATESFAKKFPPKKLLRLSASGAEALEPNESCLMIKFEPPENDGANLNIEENFGKKIREPSIFKKGIAFMKNLMNRKKTQRNGVTAINTKVPLKFPRKVISFGITSFLGIALIAAIIFTRHKKNDSVKTEQEQTPVEETTITEKPEEPISEASLPAEVFYDLRIVNSLADPISLNIVEDKIYALNKNGDLYVSETATPRFQQVPNTKFEGAFLVKSKEKELFINSAATIKNYNPEEETTEETKVEKVGIFFPYLSALYQIEENTIKKYIIGEEDKGVIWAENEDFSEAKDMTISVSIYVLTKDDHVVRYTSGVKDSGFSIKGLETELKGTIKLETNWDWTNMYIADAGNNRIVVVTKEGNFVKEIKHVNGDWTNIRAIAVTEDEKNLFVLDGTRVFEVNL